MTFCVVPGCYQPQNPDDAKICQSCGSKLILRERYRALQPLGQGGFGRTFLAVDEDIPSKPACVIKQLCLHAPNAQCHQKAVELFHQEAVRLDELGGHPQIPSLLAHFEQNRLLYLVQEFIQGPTLEVELQQQGAFSESQIWDLLRDLLPVLQFIHDRQVVHRDLKPSNLIRRLEDDKPVLIDFGIAKLITGITPLQTGTVVGSPEYMAPEQTRGKVVPATDLYSLGVVCLHLLTQRSPSDLFDIERDRWDWQSAIPGGRSVSPRLSTILDRLLKNALGDRFQSASNVLQAVEHPLVRVPRFSARDHHPAAALKQSPKTAPPTPPSPQIDYGQLERQLLARHWRQADETTWQLIRQLLGKPPTAYLFSGDLALIPCADLRRIDQLWNKYSQGRFGFSVQCRIYRHGGEDYGKFCDRVGWKPDNRQDSPDRWRFTGNAPVGHLPSRLGFGGQQWWRHLSILSQRMAECAQSL